MTADGDPRRRHLWPLVAVAVALAAVLCAGLAVLATRVLGDDTPVALAAGSSDAPARPGGGVRFPLGARIVASAAAGDHLWLFSDGPGWNGLTRVDGDRAAFWRLPERAIALAATPDGGAWAVVTGLKAMRIAPDGSVRRFALPDGSFDRTGSQQITTGPAGQLYAIAEGARLLEVTARGDVHFHDLDLPPVDDSDTGCLYGQLAPAKGGGLWIAAYGCQRILLVAPDLHSVRAFKPKFRINAVSLAVQPSGDVVFPTGSLKGPDLARVTPSGAFSGFGDTLSLASTHPTNGITAGRGEDAWAAVSGRCTARHIEGKRITDHPTPFLPYRVSPAKGDDVWIVGQSAAARVTTTGDQSQAECDVKDPQLSVSLATEGSVSLADLRRDGVTFTVDEPTILQVDLSISELGEGREVPEMEQEKLMAKAGTFNYRLPQSTIDAIDSALDEGLEPNVTDFTSATDASGNSAYPNGDAAPSTRIVR